MFVFKYLHFGSFIVTYTRARLWGERVVSRLVQKVVENFFCRGNRFLCLNLNNHFLTANVGKSIQIDVCIIWRSIECKATYSWKTPRVTHKIHNGINTSNLYYSHSISALRHSPLCRGFHKHKR